MKRVFKVELSRPLGWPLKTSRQQAECVTVADDAIKAISRAIADAKRETKWRGAWVVERVEHLGPAK